MRAYSKMAEQKMREIENEAQTKWGIKKLVVIHRIGNIKVGETSIIIGVSSEHRNEAFEACKYVINNVKTRVPIWKKEISKKVRNGLKGFYLSREKMNDKKSRGMFNVGAKPDSYRTARAKAVLSIDAKTAVLIRQGKSPKGDIVEAAKMAATRGLKKHQTSYHTVIQYL